MSRKRKKYKGIKYIATKLGKYFPNKYKTKKDAIIRARALKVEFKNSGIKPSIKSIRVREIKKREKQPELENELTTPQPYFFLYSDYPSLILASDPNIIFRSFMFEGEIQGGDIIDYHKVFAPFVNHINQMVALLPVDQSNPYEDEWQVLCTPISKDKSGKWVTEIQIIDANGNVNDYGFSPQKKGAVELILTKDKKEKEEIPTEIKETETKIEKEDKITEKEKEIELEREKQKTIQEKVKAVKDLMELGFTKEEVFKILGL